LQERDLLDEDDSLDVSELPLPEPDEEEGCAALLFLQEPAIEIPRKPEEEGLGLAPGRGMPLSGPGVTCCAVGIVHTTCTVCGCCEGLVFVISPLPQRLCEVLLKRSHDSFDCGKIVFCWTVALA
jgi:hypothetical protein